MSTWHLALGTWAVALVLAAPLDARTREAGPVRTFKEGSARVDVLGKRALFMHDVGNVRLTLSNWGEQGNPDAARGFFGFEFPLGSLNDFLFSSGIWVGAVVNGQKLVSTGTDGDNGTNEFAPCLPIDAYPKGYVATSKQYSTLAGREYVAGAKEVDDDGDWKQANNDDINGDGVPSSNWDGGKGIIGKDDDGDGSIDEERANGVNDDGDVDPVTGEPRIDEDCSDGDANGDGNAGYDPEPHIDEDPAGDISRDFIDNDFDGLVDRDDSNFDGDQRVGDLDDDGDGVADEDGTARGTQEFFTVYSDSDKTQVQNPNDPHEPLNVLVLQRTYAWGEAYAADFVIMDLVVRNVGQLPLTQVYLGLFADPDILAKGDPGDAGSTDDWNTYVPEYPPGEPMLMMVEGDDTTDVDGFGPGLFAMKVVRTPAPLSSLNVSFKNFNRLQGGDPTFDPAKYNMMSDTVSSPPSPALNDWRFLMGFGPKTGGWLLKPGEELPVTVAFIAGYKTEDLLRNAQSAQRIYDNDFQGPSAPDQPKFTLEVRPDRIRIWWWDNAEASVDPLSQKKDFEGYVLERSHDTNVWMTLAQYDVIDTLKYPEFERENLNLGMPPLDSTGRGEAGWRPEVVAIDSTVTPPVKRYAKHYWFDDRNVIRGWTYYYIVRAFDQGVPGAGPLITARGRTYQAASAGYTRQTSTLGANVEGVFVVPNPYKGSHFQEFGGGQDDAGIKIYPRKLSFMNLPASGATIDIYTLAGDHIVTLHHPAGNDLEVWDMRNKYKQEIVSGVYYYLVSAGGNKKIDKFVVLK